ncbi:FAD-binding and (Fe-S)-binding domain-containing protein [Gandjariella thermophila]|uniref:Dimethylmenaquinone methyltransferase n=1 Tax=Gandjariella thermophila TaxID=1931992 RepID=A0A4D4J4U0_9PSEU|nr:FAD-binding and (Fe-S)-binding domain-containing protein [Gandjariella thermophila]GDY29639.1 dimethylmenaquinone methyltransferase [Gandjariella thermophila]
MAVGRLIRPPATTISPRAAEVDADRLAAELHTRVRGEVRFDPGSRATYATDASNYRQAPIGVVLPETVDDGAEAVAVCREFGAPVVSRGGGTSLAGQACNVAVVIDWSKYCRRIVSVNPRRRTAIVEPGIALDPLNNQLEPYGLQLGPRPSTHVTCTVGGMIGNNSCGSTAQVYGKMLDSVLRLEVLTYDGLRMWVGETSDEEYRRILAEGGRKAELYRGMRELRDAYLADIRTRYPDIPRRVSGYNLDSLLPEHRFNVARALVGSESTLVTVLRAEIQLVERRPARALVVLGYPDVFAAADAVPRITPHQPYALEGLDRRLVQLEHMEHLAEEAIRQLPEGSGWLMVQFAGTDQDEVDRRGRRLVDELTAGRDGPTVAFLDDPRREDELWKAREAGLGATAYPPQGRETHEGWEDAAVPPERLGAYLRDFHALLDRYGYASASLYGHFGHGCVHTRIPTDLRTAEGIAAYRRFAEEAARLVADYGGSLSGEHGDGQSRGELLPIMFGERVVRAFGELKALFDPDNRMNPGKVVHPYRLDENLRQGTAFRPWQPRTHFAFPNDDHRFANAAARCVGVGKCRGHEDGVMCPSYRATREEEHSTRGRARLLFEMVAGDVITDGWRSDAVRDALDLCLACKGCRSDCPVDVDMATYKAEFLSHHYAGRLRPLAHYSMGWLPLWARIAALAPHAVNALTHTPGLARLVKAAGGVTPQRELPRFAERRFTDTVRGAGDGRLGTVLLWPDTFTNSFHPQIAHAAVAVLTDAGFGVTVPDRTVCCGLTWISTGQLGVAKRVLRRTLDALAPQLRDGTPIVVLEPSCAAVFRADLPELLNGDEDAHRLAGQTRTLAELLTERAPDWRPPELHRRAIVQPHCHQHAILGTAADRAVLDRAGVAAEVLDAGCCGLAGNFGFERGHYAVSMACAEDKLLPAVRAAEEDTLVLADGFSCRTQIEHARTGRTPRHLAEVLAGAVRRR